MASEIESATRTATVIAAHLEEAAQDLRRDLKAEHTHSMAERQALIGGLALVTAGCALANAIVAAFEDMEERERGER